MCSGAFTRSCLDLNKQKEEPPKENKKLTKWIEDLKKKGFQDATKEEIDEIRIKAYKYEF